MESHLLQMRGLKRKDDILNNPSLESHLLQMRGLKPASSTNTLPISRRIFYRCVD